MVFIDPKGDAVTDLLARLPEAVAGKVVLFDPDDRGAPPCLNVLQGDGTGTDTDMIIDNVTGIFRRIFAANWGPRTDDIFRAACLTLLGSVPPGSGLVTLADIPAAARRRRLPAPAHRRGPRPGAAQVSGTGMSSCPRPPARTPSAR